MIKNYREGDFVMTQGDGLADVDINKLIEFHQQHKKTATITVNKPVSRFGLVEFEKNGEVIDCEDVYKISLSNLDGEFCRVLTRDELFKNLIQKLSKTTIHI